MEVLTIQEQRAITDFKARVHHLVTGAAPTFRLFGSRARGDAHAESDIDILVLVDDAPTSVRSRIFEITADIFLEYEIDLSPLVMGRAHYADLLQRELLLPQDIERDGIPL